MNDYEKLYEELVTVTDRLDGIDGSAPDKDVDDLIYKANDLLKQARELAAER